MATNTSSFDANAIPPLESGDRLTADEFERRYNAMPNCKKAELINGVVHMPSRVRLRHGEPHSDLITWMGVYKAATPGVRSADNATNRLDAENEPQPDCMLFVDPEFGGHVRISPDDYVVGPAELVAEISTSSVGFDRGPKRRMFCRHGVAEYLIWQVQERVLEWNVLRNGEYHPLALNDNGVLCSEAFRGLWLDANALIRGDLMKVLATLQIGTATHEHAEFVKRLAIANF